MFTDSSIFLRDKFFSQIKLKNSSELKSIYEFFNSLIQHPVKKRLSKTKSKNQVDISINAGAKSIIQKTYLFSQQTETIEINKSIIIINIYSDTKNEKLLDELLAILQFMFSLTDTPIKYLEIDLYLVNQNKKINKTTKILSEDNVNSGFCQYGGKVTKIVIYREEELLKVFIHELIHALKLDDYNDSKEIIKHYKKKYNISSENMNTNEAYTELWANIINCYLLSQKVGRNKYNLFLILIALEKEFAKYQAEKVMYLTGLDGPKNIDINKHTNVLSYFIIRNELYMGLNKFLKYCRLENQRYVKIKNEKTFLNFLKKNEKVIKKNRRFNNTDKSAFLFTTMRMSLNEKSFYA